MEHDDEDDGDSDDCDLLEKPENSEELLEVIRSTKQENPGMFVSAWQEDDQGIRQVNLNDPQDKFFQEAEDGNVDGLRSMLEDFPDLLSTSDEDGYTALHRAAYNGHLDVLSLLLEYGADAGARTNQGWTPLHSAANWGNYEIVGRLISHGVDVNARSNGCVTPLHLAITSHCENADNVLRTVRYLLEAPGIDTGALTGSGGTPLELARRSSEAIYMLLLDRLNR